MRKWQAKMDAVWHTPTKLARHLAACPEQARPGDYYIVGDNDRRYALLLGPFRDDAGGALARLDDVDGKMRELDAAGKLGPGIGSLDLVDYGLTRMGASDDNPLGKLNAAGHLTL